MIRGIDRANAVVPPNSLVPTTKRAEVPEQEVILDRNIMFTVERVIAATAGRWHEVHLRALGVQRPPS